MAGCDRIYSSSETDDVKSVKSRQGIRGFSYQDFPVNCTVGRFPTLFFPLSSSKLHSVSLSPACCVLLERKINKRKEGK